jgi:hypothetical protein
MNPLSWKREHLLAGAIFCVIGAIGGIFFAWMQSAFHTIAAGSLSGEWSDYSRVFLLWLRDAHYWPWPTMGALVAGLSFYAVLLLRISN